MEGESEKGHAEGWTQPPQQLSRAKPQKEQNSCKQSQAMSQVLMKRLLEIFFFKINFRTCHLGYEAETEGNLFFLF